MILVFLRKDIHIYLYATSYHTENTKILTMVISEYGIMHNFYGFLCDFSYSPKCLQ